MYFAKDEKRAFHRMEINLPITMKANGEVHQGICNDLSSTGMRITFPANGFKENDEIQVSLDTNDERFLPLNAIAKLVRVTDSLDGNMTAAVEFLELK